MDSRGPVRFLWWLVRQQPGRIAMAAVYGSGWMGSIALTPWLIAQAIDRGLQAHRMPALLGWAAAVLLIGFLTSWLGIMRHRTLTRIRLTAGLSTADAVLVHATRLGAALPRRVTSGEVVTIGIGDVWVTAMGLTVFGPGVGAVVAYAVVAVLLFGVSPLLAAVVLAGVPVVALVVGPLLGRLQTTGDRYREQQGALAGRLVDVLGGLRILNGLGGKAAHADRYRRESARLRTEGYRVGAVSSWVQALSSGLPTVFVAVVTWFAVRMATRGELTVGELVVVYGSVAMLVGPVTILIESATEIGKALVAARRVLGFLRLTIEDPAGGPGPRQPAPLHDPRSGVTAAPDELTVLAGTGAAAVLDRLGRYDESAATWGGIRLDTIDKGVVRDRLLVADPDADLFAGAVREVIAGRHDVGDDEVRRAVHTAVAQDVAADLDHHVDWDGRNLSGGQRQRVRLARALLADPEMLLAAEPTSAVDAHTEAAIAERLTAARAGRGTVLVTLSPVLLDRADTVHYLVDGRVVASGRHRELLADEAGYRTLVSRDDLIEEGTPQ